MKRWTRTISYLRFFPAVIHSAGKNCWNLLGQGFWQIKCLKISFMDVVMMDYMDPVPQCVCVCVFQEG